MKVLLTVLLSTFPILASAQISCPTADADLPSERIAEVRGRAEYWSRNLGAVDSLALSEDAYKLVRSGPGGSAVRYLFSAEFCKLIVQRADLSTAAKQDLLDKFNARVVRPPAASDAYRTEPIEPKPQAAKKAKPVKKAAKRKSATSPSASSGEWMDKSHPKMGREPAPTITAKENGVTFPVWFGTNRQPVSADDHSKGYGGARASTINYGKCLVAIPKGHVFGSTGRQWYQRFTSSDEPLKLGQVIPLNKQAFLDDVRRAINTSDGKTLLLYIHGFRVTFEEAAIRAAQMGFDLGIDGVTAFYSWPSAGTLAGYGSDVASVEAAEELVSDFITTMAKMSEAKQVHIVAHSMGNLGLLRAFNRATTQAALNGVKFGQIFLAAPDVDVDLFRQLAVIYPKISERTTLYVSAKDKALEASHWLRDFQRAGYTPPVTAIEGIDTIEVTDIDLSVVGHGYYAEAADVLRDMHALMRHNEPPSRRFRLQKSLTADGKTYWTIRK